MIHSNAYEGDDKNGINACKLLGIQFTTAIGILIRMREKKLFTIEEAEAKLALLEKQGSHKQSSRKTVNRSGADRFSNQLLSSWEAWTYPNR